MQTNRKTAFLRRARVALLLALAVFAGVQIGLRVLVDEVKPELRDPIFEIKYREFSRLLQQDPKPGAVVFLGSSMSGNGMKARIAEAPLTASLGRPVVSYNLATNGGGPITHLVYVQRLLRRGVRPEMVVLEVSPLLLFPGQTKMDHLRFPGEVLEREDLDILERYSAPSDLREDWWKAQLVPIYGHRRAILNQSAPLLVPFNERVQLWTEMDERGWSPHKAPTPEEHRVALGQTEMLQKNRLAKYTIDELPLKGLRELGDLLTKERIKAVLVVMPAGPMLRSYYPPGATDSVLAEFQALSRSHGFVLVNAHEWYEEDCFVDSYHLHEAAAHAFTERLVREVIAGER